MGRKSKRLHVPVDAVGNGLSSAGKGHKVGIYARLSVNREEKNESIDAQMAMAKKFVEDWNGSHTDKMEIIDCYKDV